MNYGQKRGGGACNCGDYSCRVCYYPIDPNKAQRAVPLAAPTQARIWLNVPYIEKEGAKAQGAKWDAGYKRWYAPTKEIEATCKRWAIPVVTPPAARGVQTSLGLSRGTRQVAQPIAPAAPVEEVREPKQGTHSFDELMAALGTTPETEIEYLTVGRTAAKYA